MLRERFEHWDEVRAGLLDLLGRLSDDDLGFVPAPGLWPLRRVVAHIADTEQYWIDHVLGGAPEHELVNELGEDAPAAALREALADVHLRALAVLDTFAGADLGRRFAIDNEEHTLEWVVWHVIEHEIHHRGEISLAFGLLGREGLDA